MKITSVLSLGFVLAVVCQMAAALAFAFASTGYYSIVNEGVFACRELLSSGNDDELTMVVFVGMSISVALRILRFSKAPNLLEFSAFGLMNMIGFAVSFPKDCGDVVDTVFVSHEPYLVLVWVGAFFGMIFLALLLIDSRHKP